MCTYVHIYKHIYLYIHVLRLLSNSTSNDLHLYSRHEDSAWVFDAAGPQGALSGLSKLQSTTADFLHQVGVKLSSASHPEVCKVLEAAYDPLESQVER